MGNLISQAKRNKIKALQNACIRILINGRLRQLTLSMYKTTNSIRCVEMVKLSLVLFMYKDKKGMLPVPTKTPKIDQTHEILFPSREGMLHSYTITVP